MDKELIVQGSPTRVEIALVEDQRLVELHQQKTKSHFSVGDIFLGKIKKIMPSLNAVFVDIGHRKDAFLHYTDMGPKLRTIMKYTEDSIAGKQQTALLDTFEFEPEIIKTGKVDQVIKKNENILIQILKEPISTKGPRLSCEITIPGRFIVLTPFSNTIAVSKKIGQQEERKRLQLLIESIRPKNFGVIVRTAAEGKKVADLHEELKELLDKWSQIHKQLYKRQQPAKLLSELDKTSSILRDMLNDDFSSIIVNDKDIHDNIQDYLTSIAPGKTDIVQLYKGKKPIFEAYGVTRQIKSSFGKTATLPSGAYLVIEHTEALHVIDVNSGPKMQRKDQESTAVAVNLEAAEEIARQLRLRDIGGLIVIDFIDMKNPDNKVLLAKHMKDAMKRDAAQHTILPLTKFGLMQITRQRVRPEVKIDTAEICYTCKGTGKVNPTVLITDEILRDLEYIQQSRPKTGLRVEVHPYVRAFLRQGFPNFQLKWWMKNQRWLSISANPDFSLHEYKFFDKNNDEIRLYYGETIEKAKE
jgi:ribonuclease G